MQINTGSLNVTGSAGMTVNANSMIELNAGNSLGVAQR